jgi:hypothetical protein
MNDVKLQIKKNRLDMEHSDLLETRNAIYLLETGLPLGTLALFELFSKMPPPDSVTAILAVVLVTVAIDTLRVEYDRRIHEKQREVEDLISEGN